MSDLKIFTEFNNIDAGFTRKPDTSIDRREDMISHAKKLGGCVVKPILVHGNVVAPLTKEMIENKSYLEIPDTDGVVTDALNVVLTTTHADCIPLFAYDPKNSVIGIAHAGWKGTSNGIAYELIKTMKESFACKSNDIYTFIGPGIGKCHFEFGKDYADECFISKYPWMKDYISEEQDDKVKIDLKSINEHFFNLAGVRNVKISNECTYCDERYYSYRRAKDEKRMIAYISMIR